MPVYNNPDFRSPPPGLAAIFAAAGKQSFFSLPEWYDLLGRCATLAGSEIRVYTDERRGSMVALPLQISGEDGGDCLASLANFYSGEHGLVHGGPGALNGCVECILSEIN